ncbi:hypothetical protein ACPPVO_22455 [Dactylosporangium sp. McL0621]|uniref:hypothetical protein n=1 Tax=Dactylosporangium sp. McL0621 TaxID=3415678 RepID=UPI003CF277C2
MLIASGSEREACNADVLLLDPAELAADRPDWDAALAAALDALGITPNQGGPAWLVFPSYA